MAVSDLPVLFVSLMRGSPEKVHAAIDIAHLARSETLSSYARLTVQKADKVLGAVVPDVKWSIMPAKISGLTTFQV